MVDFETRRIVRHGKLGDSITWRTPGLRVHFNTQSTRMQQKMLNWQRVAKGIRSREAGLRKQSADWATRVSQAQFESGLSARPGAPKGRLGRASTEGEFSNMIKWIPESGERSGNNTVRFQYEAFEPQYRYWVIQEIGTGRSATAYRIGRNGPEEFRRIAVRSQRGRPITAKLQWADAVGGPFSTPSARRDQQLFLHDNPEKFSSKTLDQKSSIMTANILIRREIRAKNYIQEGGRRGAYVYITGMKALMSRGFGLNRG